ncbi:aldo/keto reductase [Eubacteriales bacterium OttesenSCG-928-A19]|nr:aldo/keto reductase [Eubacteriales bacterium OttesenSCG-928-A19]
MNIAEGIALSEIALGDSKRGVPELEARAFDVMDYYMERGGRTFDSARIYNDGGADRAFGKWLRERGIARDSVQLVTKGSHPDLAAMHINRLSAEEIERDLDESLALAQVEYSDLHLLHRDDVKLPVEEIMPSLDALVRKGKARAIGVSNWTVTRIAQANEFALQNGLEPIRCSQVLFSLAQTTAAATGDLTHIIMNEVELRWYRDSQLPVMCFGAQARGWFAARAEGREPQASPRKYFDLLPENHRRLIRLRKLAEKLGRPMAAITTAYVRDHGLNAVALCSFSSRKQLDEVFEAEAFRLTPDQIKYLETGVGTC